MPELKNKQHEGFAQGIHNGLSPLDAHIAAGLSRKRADAEELAKQPEIVERVEELAALEDSMGSVEDSLTEKMLEDLINPTSVGHAFLVMQFFRNAIQARGIGDLKESNAALREIGRLRGLFDHPDLPTYVKKARRENGQLDSPDAGDEAALPQQSGFAGLLGTHPDEFVEGEVVDTPRAEEVFADAVGDE